MESLNKKSDLVRPITIVVMVTFACAFLFIGYVARITTNCGQDDINEAKTYSINCFKPYRDRSRSFAAIARDSVYGVELSQDGSVEFFRHKDLEFVPRRQFQAYRLTNGDFKSGEEVIIKLSEDRTEVGFFNSTDYKEKYVKVRTGEGQYEVFEESQVFKLTSHP